MNKTEMLKWRLLKDGIRDPFHHFALEEALLRGIDDGITPPTLRLRQTEPSVWIGVYQYPEEDVDMAYCTKKGIKIVRRPNPGGAVYQDEGSFCYSLFFPKKPLFNQLHITKAEQLYPIFGKAVIETCREFGVDAELSPVNDITIGGRKVYGAAQVELYSAFVHSGTFLVKTDLDEMERCLKPSKLKFIDKGFLNVKARVVNLCDAAGMDIEIRKVMEKLVRHVAEVLGVDFYSGFLSSEEISSANYLYDEKYVKPEWTFRKRDTYNTIISTKSLSGVITVGISMEGGTIADLEIKGDFLIPNQEELMRVIQTIKGRRVDTISSIVESSRLPTDIKKSLIGLLKNISTKGVSDGTS
jgi:lipoate-protein ligase A